MKDKLTAAIISLTRSPSAFTLIGVIIGCIVGYALLGCATGPSKYALDHQESVIVQALQRANVDPVIFGDRVARGIKSEIMAGKWTKKGVQDWIDIQRGKLMVGQIDGNAMADMADKYTIKFMLGGDTSQAAILAYYVLAPDFSRLRQVKAFAPDDLKVIHDALTSIEVEINK